MFDIHRVQLDWGGRKLVLETGKIARQADGAVVATYGETKVLATVVAAKEPREGVDFLPLTVDYQEKFYAAGRIPGGYFKREGRPTEKETLVSRLIDRPVRPLFAEGWRNETQVIVTTLSHDLENDPDVLAMIAASAALTLSGAPFMGPIGAARVGFVNNEYVLNPLLDEMTESQLDLVVAGTQDAVLMVESEAKELSEDVMLGAVMFGHRHFQPVIDAIIKLAEKAAKEPRELQVADTAALEKEMLALIDPDLRAAYAIANKRLPETLTIYHNGHLVMRSLTNTGIPVAPTVNGTFPVFSRFRYTIMSGTNPGGRHYADPVPFASYFNGGDAVHYFPRGGYGYEQSLGCVELPYDAAARAYPYLTYGSLVTVDG